MQYFVISCYFVSIYHRFLCNNVNLCLVMLVCNDTMLFYNLESCFVSCYVVLQGNIVLLCFVMLFCNDIMLFRNVMQCCFIHDNIVLCLVMLFAKL